MNKLKDWLYDRSDLLVAMVIICVSALIILNRVSSIMAFPDSFDFLPNNDGTAQIHSSSQAGGDSSIDSSDNSQGALETENSNSEQITSDIAVSANITSAPATTAPSVEVPPLVQKQVVIDVPSGSTAAKIATLLKDAGAIENTKDFLSVLASSGLDSKLKSGKFTIPAGSTLNDIVNILTNR